MFEVIFLIAVGVTLGWFVFPVPKLAVDAKNALCRRFPGIKAVLKDDDSI